MARNRLSEAHQKKIALELFLDAWDTAGERGVTNEVLAEVLIYLAVTDLVADRGEDWTADMIEDLPERIQSGEFTIPDDDDESPVANA